MLYTINFFVIDSLFNEINYSEGVYYTKSQGS